MNNLELLELKHDFVTEIFRDVTFFNHTLNDIFYVKGASLYKHDTTLNTSEELCPQIFNDIISIKVLEIEQKVCLVTKHTLHIVDPKGDNEIQIVSFEEEIAAIEWSLSEEAVVIVFENGNIAVFSVDYENGEIFSQGSSSVDAKVPDTLYVGWGSKDTQFRGSEGKLKNKSNEKPGNTRTYKIVFIYLNIIFRQLSKYLVILLHQILYDNCGRVSEDYCPIGHNLIINMLNRTFVIQ